MRRILVSLALFWGVEQAFGAQEEVVSTPQQALEKLMAGNERYVSGKTVHPNQDLFRREGLVKSQAPFAVIISCSDSRVSPEVIFDQGLGDTFIVRIAGNVMGTIVTESIMFGADALKAPLILVLGHSNCGAIKAAIEGGNATRDIPEVAKQLAPALKVTPTKDTPRLEQVIKTNVEYVRDRLRAMPLLAQLVREKKLMIVGGYYDLENGKVSLLETSH